MRRTLWRGFLNPWFQIFFGAIVVTASELFLKRGATETASPGQTWGWTGVSGLESPWVWGGIAFVIVSFLSWLYVLKHIPLTIAFPLSNVVHVLVPLCSWIFLGEAISRLRWCGIALVLAGLVVVAKPFAKIEERL